MHKIVNRSLRNVALLSVVAGLAVGCANSSDTNKVADEQKAAAAAQAQDQQNKIMQRLDDLQRQMASINRKADQAVQTAQDAQNNNSERTTRAYEHGLRK